MVRHAESLANYTIGKWDAENKHLKETEEGYEERRIDEVLGIRSNTDAPLTEKGIQQARDQQNLIN